MSDGPETSLFELFRSEVQTHTAVIKEGLQDYRNKRSNQQIAQMIQSAHAIWGGARIVEFASAEKMARTLKECFNAIQSGKCPLNPTDIDILFQAVEQLIQLSEDATQVSSEETVDSLVTALLDILKTGKQEATAQPNQITPSATPLNDQPTTIKPEQPQPDVSENITVMGDSPLMELFRTEVETNVAILNESLLALENDPNSSEKLEALMRGAHSIKGGARVIGLDMAVKLAHVMEDCFVAAQKGKLFLNADYIDFLLQGVDMLVRIAEVAHSKDALNELKAENDHLVAILSSILSGGDKPGSKSPASTVISGDESPAPKSSPSTVAPVNPTPAAPVTPNYSNSASDPPSSTSPINNPKLTIPQPSKETPQQPVILAKKMGDNRMIRVTAAKIERLMGLAGEVVVSARWLPPFSESLLELKKNHARLASILEKIQDTLNPHDNNDRLLKLLSQARETTKECTLCLADRLNKLDVFTSAAATHSDRLYHEVIGVRMRPFADGAQGFPRMVRDLAKELGKKVRFEIIGKSTEIDQDIQEKLDAPLNHLLRNAIDHGIETPAERIAADKAETGVLQLEVVHRLGMLMINISDDGRGIDPEKLRQKVLQKELASPDIVDKLTETELMDFLFLPGFSTVDNVTEISGRGVGLDIVHSMVHEVGGVVRATSVPGKGLTFHLELPLTLSVLRTFLVEIAGESYAFPLARIDRCLILPTNEIDTVEDREYFRFGNQNIALVDIHDVLEMESFKTSHKKLAVVVISDRLNSYGLVVDKFLGECDLVVRPIDRRLGKVPDISAVAVMLDGSPVLIFDVEDLVRSIDNLLSGKRLRKINELGEEKRTKKPKRILVVDDSITVREMERKLLENSGYQVEVAVDGMDGWNAVRTSRFDLVVSDVDMPRMNGIQLISHLKQHEELKSLPVIIVSYKDTQEHRLQGLEAGANYYLTKSSFEDDSFINAVFDLIGEA